MKNVVGIFKSPYFIICGVVMAIYGWSISFGFLYYDDHLNIFENQPLLSGQVLYFWKYAHEGLYVPLVYTIWSLIYKAVGLNPAAFHGMNVLLHLLNSMLVFFISCELKISKKASLIGALLFAAHPFQVESVAWVTSFKDTSFAFFSLLALWIYLFSSQSKLVKWVLGFGAVSAAILCKPTAAVLPVFICLYILASSSGPLRDRLQRLFREVGPLPLALVLGFFCIQMAKTGQSWSEHPKALVSLFEKPVIALDSLGFYLLKLVIPSDFYVDYARFPRNVLDNGLFYLTGAVALIFLAVLLRWLFKANAQNFHVRLFAALLGVLFFLPTSGLISFGHQRISTTADRYMYFVMVGVAIAVAAIFEKVQASYQGKHLSKIAGIILAVLSAISFMQSINWKDTALFTENLYEGNPNNYFANRNIGLINQMKGNDEKALEFFKRASQIDPTHLSAHAAIVSLYFNKSEYDKMDQYIQENLVDEKLRMMEQTPFETHGFFMAVAESYLDRKNYEKAMIYLCKAKSLKIAQFASEVETKINVARKSIGDSSFGCAN